MVEQEFADFAAAAWPRLYRSMYAVARDQRDAEDAVQSALAEAQRHWAKVRTAGDPLAYTRRIALTALLAERRKPRWRHELASDDIPDQHATETRDLAEQASARLTMVDAIRQLPPRQRAIVVLRYYDDLSEAQIAEALGCRPGTVKSQASAALTTVRRTLGAADLEPEESR